MIRVILEKVVAMILLIVVMVSVAILLVLSGAYQAVWSIYYLLKITVKIVLLIFKEVKYEQNNRV